MSALRAPLLLAALLLVAALPSGAAVELRLEVANAAPRVEAVRLYATDPAARSARACAADGHVDDLAPQAGAQRWAHVCVEVADANGHADVCRPGLVHAHALTLRRAGAGEPAAASAALRCLHGSGTTATVVGAIALEHWRAPGAYVVGVSLSDARGARAEGAAPLAYAALVAGEVRAAGPGDACVAPKGGACVLLVNAGNAPLALRLTGAGGEATLVPVDPEARGVPRALAAPPTGAVLAPLPARD